MITKLYGIDFTVFVCGGLGNKLCPFSQETMFYNSETEMLKSLIKLKEDKTVGNISLFTTTINRKEYKI